MATKTRSIAALPRVSSITPIRTIEHPTRVIVIAEAVGDNHVNGRATSANKGE